MSKTLAIGSARLIVSWQGVHGHLDRLGWYVYAAYLYHLTGMQGTRREKMLHCLLP